ncbi:hypothetical protein EAKF1_ch4176c [Escherichia albertii KF1]|nr:hypothetical protein EAKF1_ch4176c [Escherichia albertii KF1]
MVNRIGHFIHMKNKNIKYINSANIKYALLIFIPDVTFPPG